MGLTFKNFPQWIKFLPRVSKSDLHLVLGLKKKKVPYPKAPRNRSITVNLKNKGSKFNLERKTVAL